MAYDGHCLIDSGESQLLNFIIYNLNGKILLVTDQLGYKLSIPTE